MLTENMHFCILNLYEPIARKSSAMSIEIYFSSYDCFFTLNLKTSTLDIFTRHPKVDAALLCDRFKNVQRRSFKIQSKETVIGRKINFNTRCT
jgi:hypothetical protein